MLLALLHKLSFTEESLFEDLLFGDFFAKSPMKFYKLRNTIRRGLSKKVQREILNHKRKNNDWKDWVSPSRTRNFILDDLISDVLMWRRNNPMAVAAVGSSSVATHSANNVNDPTIPITKDELPQKYNQINSNSGCFILNQGNEFERGVIKLLKQRFPGEGEIEDIYGNGLPRSYVLADKSIEAIEKGTPIIISPVFHDFDSKVFGVPDLLIRSDYMSKIFKYPPEMDEGGCRFSNQWYYVIVDIKFSTLFLRANGVELLNHENFKAYKAQLYLYNHILSKIQGCDPGRTYVLGRTYKFSNSVDGDMKGNGCFDKPGVIDYNGWDEEYHTKVKKSVKWLRTCGKIARNFTLQTIRGLNHKGGGGQSGGGSWNGGSGSSSGNGNGNGVAMIAGIPSEPSSKSSLKISKKSKFNLYPNLCVDNLFFQKEKWEIAKAISDITMLPYCGVKQRENAIKNGVDDWKNPKCTSETLGFKKDTHHARIVDACLAANRGTNLFVHSHSDATPNFSKLKAMPDSQKIYIDFETVSNVCDDFTALPRPSDIDIAFMLTVGHVKKIAATAAIASTAASATESSSTSESGEKKGKGKKGRRSLQPQQIQQDPSTATHVSPPQTQPTKSEFVVKTFTSQGLTNEFEREMFQAAMQYISSLMPMNEATIVHWGHCDKTTWKKIERRYNLAFEPKGWFDAYGAMQNNSIGIRGCFSYSLKPVCNMLNEYGLVTQKFVGEEHGLEAMHQAYIAHKESVGDVFINHHYIQKLKDYNVKDVLALREVTKVIEGIFPFPFLGT